MKPNLSKLPPKRYIVTDEQLWALERAVSQYESVPGVGNLLSHFYDKWTEARKACFSVPVPEWATHFAGDPYPGYDTEFKLAEEMPRCYASKLACE